MAVAANKRPVMTLFSGDNDLYSHQVRIVLAEKGVTFDLHTVVPDNIPEALFEINPYGSVPTLIDRELGLFDSGIIMEYLDERFPHPPLMPVYPVARGRCRLMMVRINRDWYTLAHQILSNEGDLEQARQQLREGLLSVAPIFAEAPYFMSEEFSLMDCYLAPLLWRLPSLGIEIAGPGSKHLKEYMIRIFERESFQGSLTDLERELRA